MKIKAPCPFCGTGPEDHDEGSPILHVDFENDAWFVKCSNCGARGPRAFSEIEAIKLWNEGKERIRIDNGAQIGITTLETELKSVYQALDRIKMRINMQQYKAHPATLNGYPCKGNLFVTREYQHVEDEISGQSWEALVLKSMKGKIICNIPENAIPQEGDYEGYFMDEDKEYYGKVRVVISEWHALEDIAEIKVVGLGAPIIKAKGDNNEIPYHTNEQRFP